MAEAFVRDKFSHYYSTASPEPPTSPGSREWGFGGWVKKIETRHFSFQSTQDLHAYLRRNAPFYISYSSAYYEFPEARPMERKRWLGADLIFDIDADQLNPPCIKEHGPGWVCDKCLDLTKDEAVKLMEEFLIKDFGFGNILVNFSGNRGYHIHVMDEEIRELSGSQRRELSDYISGKGLNYKSFLSKKSSRWEGPRPDDPAWGGRIAKGFVSMLKEKKLERILKPTTAKRFYKMESEVIAGIGRGNWDVVGIKNHGVVWNDLVEFLGINLGDNIDQNVTFDTSKLIRMPDSLHGETGLLAKRVKDLDRFDPLSDTVVFGKEPLKVKITKAHPIRIWDETFGPYENQTLELPEAVAIYLMCKKTATCLKGSS
ncbi:MAG: DNA primase catalytic subunit PriS [Candidatus Micrarchaeota archaeon]